ncbi:hypothetical protein F511_17968 [Dorcoceras hygrometricum]|uniref:Uncharacterized protein n=1 Tax=Dorcoceras hygrometricum TaxID=472368 RepID=A0A2Z7AD08_9LAMI|nr:hypothetical protein F511_17968 [Dorcoceras hygrometricum]
MASSLISNSHHIDFDSVFDMDDAGLAQVFETFIATGLRNFLGCPAVFYVEALLEFFTNGSVGEDGMVVSTIRGTTIEISESLFATAFDLPTEGLTDLSDVPKDKIFDARSLFSASKEQARRKNFVSGTPTSAIDLKILKLLGAAHLFALNVLLRHMREHQLEWKRPYSSSLFEGPVIDRGFFIPPNHHSITSKCWIRAKIMVDGSWLILEGVDYCRPINTPVNSKHWKALPQRPYLDDLAPLSVFVEPVQDIDSRPSLSRAISIVWAEICMEAVQFSLLGSLRPVGSVNFCRDLVVRGSVVKTTFPATTTDLSPLLDDLKTSLSQSMDNAHSDILSRLHTIERGLQNTLGHQNDYFRNLIQNTQQEGQNQDYLQILRLNELKKTVMAQGVTADTDSLEIRNRFNALDAKILLFDGEVAAIRSEHSKKKWQQIFSASPPRLAISSTTFVAVMPKRGKEAAVAALYLLLNQGESSGNVIRTTNIISPTDIDAAQRDIME